MKVVVLILARGGSKSLPLKNLLPVAGVPCVARAIATARLALGDAPIVVSTDHAEIAGLAGRCGADVIDRPAELATDTAEGKYVIRHACETFTTWGWRPMSVVFLEGNTAIFRPAIVAEAVDLLFDAQASGVQPVVQARAETHPDMALGVAERGRLLIPETYRSNRQSLRRCWQIGFGGAVLRPSNFDIPDNGPLWYLGDDVVGQEVQPLDAVHIDSEHDLRLANLLATDSQAL